MTFWQKIKQTFRSFMNGRHGADQLSMALLWTGLIGYLVGSILAGVQGFFLWPLLGIVLTLLSPAAYVLCIFRMFSRNNERREAENRRYLSMVERRRTARRREGPLSEPKEVQVFPLSSCPHCAAARHGRCDGDVQPLPHELYPEVLMGSKEGGKSAAFLILHYKTYL